MDDELDALLDEYVFFIKKESNSFFCQPYFLTLNYSQMYGHQRNVEPFFLHQLHHCVSFFSPQSLQTHFNHSIAQNESRSK